MYLNLEFYTFFYYVTYLISQQVYLCNIQFNNTCETRNISQLSNLDIVALNKFIRVTNNKLKFVYVSRNVYILYPSFIQVYF